MLHRTIPPDHPAYATVERQEALFQAVRSNIVRAQERQGRYYNARRRAVTYNVGDLVWVRAFPQSRAEDSHMAKLAPKWKGPAKILKALNKVNYQ
ncbi:Transposon Ty3-I Gag-Pol poly, partial [Clarias magur]